MLEESERRRQYLKALLHQAEDAVLQADARVVRHKELMEEFYQDGHRTRELDAQLRECLRISIEHREDLIRHLQVV